MKRFWDKVNIRDKDACWEWQAATAKGYGAIRIDGRLRGAHQVSWELHNHQTVPDGMFVLHECDNRSCVNPHHLFLGTHQDNMDDMYAKGRRIAASGESSGSSKLTHSQVEQIRRLSPKHSRRELAHMFGVKAHATINKILSGKTWRVS